MDLSRFPYLQGNYAPVLEESDISHSQLRIEGEIPKVLNGAFMRNGANVAFEPEHYTYPLDGDGMIHAVYLQDGKAHYRNRWVQTKELAIERQLGRAAWGSTGKITPVPQEALDLGASPNPLKNPANTHIWRHAEQLMALWEGGYPYLLNDDLSTVGVHNFDNSFEADDVFFAHPKVCGVTGQYVTCTKKFSNNIMNLRIYNKQGRHIKAIPVDLEHKQIVHDLQLAGNYIIIFVAPAYHNVEASLAGENPFQWHGDESTRILAVHRDTGEIIRFEAPAFFSWHFCNGYQQGNSLIVDYVWMESLPFAQEMTTGVERQNRHMHRMTLDLTSRQITDEKVSTIYNEFCRSDDRRCGEYYRLGFSAASTSDKWATDYHGYNSTARFDFESGDVQLFNYGDEANAGEPVFVPHPDSAAEHAGFVMTYVNNPTEGSFLAILSASNFNHGPVAKIHFPVRVPNGFHANWMPGLKLG